MLCPSPKPQSNLNKSINNKSIKWRHFGLPGAGAPVPEAAFSRYQCLNTTYDLKSMITLENYHNSPGICNENSATDQSSDERLKTQRCNMLNSSHDLAVCCKHQQLPSLPCLHQAVTHSNIYEERPHIRLTLEDKHGDAQSKWKETQTL